MPVVARELSIAILPYLACRGRVLVCTSLEVSVALQPFILQTTIHLSLDVAAFNTPLSTGLDKLKCIRRTASKARAASPRCQA
jgi:hypothetical protein